MSQFYNVINKDLDEAMEMLREREKAECWRVVAVDIDGQHYKVSARVDLDTAFDVLEKLQSQLSEVGSVWAHDADGLPWLLPRERVRVGVAGPRPTKGRGSS